MDASRFDRLSRLLATAPTRRTALAGLAGLLGQTLRAPADADARLRICRPLGDRCFPNRGLDCCKGECRSGRCRCPEGQRRCGHRCLRTGRRCRRARKHSRSRKNRCRPNQKRCRGRCIPKHACCGGCPEGQVCRNGGCCNVTTGPELQAALTDGPDTIRLCPNTTYEGIYTIERPVTVIGAGPTSSILDGAQIDTVVTNTATATVHFQDLGIINGFARGAVRHGGGIHTEGPLTLTRCRVATNTAYRGGGIFTSSTLTLIDTVVARNQSDSDGGIYAVSWRASVILQGASRVEHNQATNVGGAGGGVGAENDATVTLQDRSVVRLNEAPRGGGIYLDAGCVANLNDDSRVETNTATEEGGGVIMYGAQLALHDRSRITGNRALGGPDSGGGIFADGSSTVDLPAAAMVTGNTPDQCQPSIVTGSGTCE